MPRTYVGNATTHKLMLICSFPIKDFSNKNSALSFIKENGLLVEFALLNKNSSRSKYAHWDRTITYDDRDDDLERVEHKNETYWIGDLSSNDDIAKAINGSHMEVYKEVPNVINDDVFFWKENSRTGARDAVIVRGDFEYHCRVLADGDGFVDIKYAACMNRHANRVTVATIEVINASNEAFEEAIAEWKRNFGERFAVS